MSRRPGRPDDAPGKPSGGGEDRIGPIVRRVDRYTYGFLGAALLVAVAGAGLVAWFLRPAGLPFLTSWLVMTLLVLLPSALRYMVQRYRESIRDRRRQDTGGKN